jgi:biotin operon repressor
VNKLGEKIEASIDTTTKSYTQNSCSLPKKLNQLDSMLKNSFESIKEEFDEHLQAINENTQELQLHESHLDEIDSRITKLEEKIDAVHMLLKQLVSERLKVDLSKDEQKTFLILYTHEQQLSADAIAAKTEMTKEEVTESINAMQDKGIPVTTGVNSVFKLDDAFRLRQAKEGIIKIDPEVIHQFQNKLLNQFFSN